MVAVAVRERSETYGRATLGDERRQMRADARSTAPDIGQAPTEATLAQLWAGQRFPAAALVTRQGMPLRVLHPGWRGRGAGPDFRDAIIATPSDGLLRGDVELHVRASDFRAHGHHRDPRYDGVALHLVFEDDGAGDTRLASGRRVPVVALAPWATRRAEELQGWLASPTLWREPCHDALARLGAERLSRTLDDLGEQRFARREAVLAQEIERHGPGEALYRALLAGLGYGGERAALPDVADSLPWRVLAGNLSSALQEERPLLAEALLLGAAGLLPSQEDKVAEGHREAQWELRWRGSGLIPVPAALLPGASARPANHPSRRLAGLARLLVRHGLGPEGWELDGGCDEPNVDGKGDLAGGQAVAGTVSTDQAATKRLVAAWSVPADGYWRTHRAPGLASSRSLGALIGRSRAVELLVNAVLPWAAARAEAGGDGKRAAGARDRFARLPRPGRYGRLAFLETNLRAGGRPLRLDARRQQGLLELYKTECTQGGCGRCPLS